MNHPTAVALLPAMENVCPICLKTYSTKHRGYNCQFCSASFTLNSNMLRHVRTKHLNETPYSCPVCKKGWRRSDAFKEHVFRVHEHSNILNPEYPDLVTSSNDEDITCPYCQRCLFNQISLQRHILLHLQSKDRGHQCNICMRVYSKVNPSSYKIKPIGIRYTINGLAMQWQPWQNASLFMVLEALS
ncbi:Zinc finger protein 648 like protein [Argiope bruennichi]|uniref:Zinc finger protein 648 like protein n=1 Tax=Argiope bruennichi TaxID=94029 RepID=A0A8T0E7A4_ARGBR|nr:Zinc finger protein 648 like protein [Argiope bruennichi]